MGIVEANGLLCKNDMRALPYLSLANEDVQTLRAGKTVFDRPLHDYVPLYFGKKTPMVAVNGDRNEEMIFFRYSLNILAWPDVVFSDGNAATKSTVFHLFQSIESLDALDTSAVLATRYAGDLELKRRKQAEILVPSFLSLPEAYEIICFSEGAKKKVEYILSFDRGLNIPVRVDASFYFRRDDTAA